MSKFETLSPMLLTDFYKTIHHLAYVPKMQYLVSYWTPRKSRYADCDSAVVFGLQGVTKKYLIEYFNKHFFNRPLDEVKDEYVRYIANTMSEQAADTSVLEALHNLGYLPIRIRALPEGTVVKIRTPIYEFSNTVEGFGWLVNYLETYLSVNIWKPINSATVGHRYRLLVNDYFAKTVSKNAVAKVVDGVRIPTGVYADENCEWIDGGNGEISTGCAMRLIFR
jgi:nicotinamide phosphoribosyltransferase